ncbi:MAG: hypothetical protein UW87_C0029G0007 [Candidatus Moranbacteria bacterium GW2011_GWC2_45_10]|nr:MAG: hypothetical protein UW87_C0029G0007 [Candidatus Moranbacteria bacterium GW2011_GWC2_45_10]
MRTKEDLLQHLNTEAKAKGLCRCCTCGYTWKHGERGTHTCTNYMVPKDLIEKVLVEIPGNNFEQLLKALL